ncbi:MAG TPA: hypothetical protein V6D12_07710 [Candidatus Obscuribacterales bacterium]
MVALKLPPTIGAIAHSLLERRGRAIALEKKERARHLFNRYTPPIRLALTYRYATCCHVSSQAGCHLPTGYNQLAGAIAGYNQLAATGRHETTMRTAGWYLLLLTVTYWGLSLTGCYCPLLSLTVPYWLLLSLTGCYCHWQAVTRAHARAIAQTQERKNF